MARRRIAGGKFPRAKAYGDFLYKGFPLIFGWEISLQLVGLSTVAIIRIRESGVLPKKNQATSPDHQDIRFCEDYGPLIGPNGNGAEEKICNPA